MAGTRIIPYVLAYFERDAKVLLSLRGSSASFGAHQYSLIGGKVDVDESPSDALIREVAEEVGIKITIDDLQMGTILYFKGVKETCVAFTFRVTKWQGEPSNKEPEKQEKIEWIALNALPENLLPRHRYIIGCMRESIFYAEWGFNGPTITRDLA